MRKREEREAVPAPRTGPPPWPRLQDFPGDAIRREPSRPGPALPLSSGSLSRRPRTGDPNREHGEVTSEDSLAPPSASPAGAAT
jgi:hypothetical protein